MAKSSKKSKSQQGKRAKLLENLEGRKLLASTLVITKGGVYSGEWESLDRNVPAVTVCDPNVCTLIALSLCELL